MTATAQAPLSANTRRLVDAVVQDLVSAQSRSGTDRDVGVDEPAVGDGPGPGEGGQDSQRFFGGLISALVTHVVPAVAPHIFGMLQQRRRDLGLPEQRDAASVERDFGAILSALLPKLLDAVPALVSQLTSGPPPRSVEEENQRIFPLLGMLIPAIASAVPSIISAFNQQRGADATPPAMTDPEAQRFFGSLFAAVAPTLLQAAPSILGSIFGGRGLTTPAASDW